MSKHLFYLGDVRTCLHRLPQESVDCVVTSPPYFGLRDYKIQSVLWPEVQYHAMPGLPHVSVPSWEGQLGLERSVEMYVAHIILVFREIRRVLKPSGTCWVNLGDSYARNAGVTFQGYGKHAIAHSADVFGRNGRVPGVEPKDLLGIPWQVAIALRTDGWYLRQDVIWDKPNALPESVRDRPTRNHEYVFLLGRSEQYWYDKTAIEEPMSCPQDSTPEDLARAMSRRRATMPNPRQAARVPAEGVPPVRNARSVWRIPTASFAGAHFAVFPENLAERCILAGCPPYVCSACGTPFVREVIKTGHVNQREGAHVPGNRGSKTDSTGWAPTTMALDRFLPVCKCAGGGGTWCSIGPLWRQGNGHLCFDVA